MDVDSAKHAYSQLNGAELDGRKIKLDGTTKKNQPKNFGGKQEVNLN